MMNSSSRVGGGGRGGGGCSDCGPDDGFKVMRLKQQAGRILLVNLFLSLTFFHCAMVSALWSLSLRTRTVRSHCHFLILFDMHTLMPLCVLFYQTSVCFLTLSLFDGVGSGVGGGRVFSHYFL